MYCIHIFFTELNYNSGTGEHEVQADYSALTQADPDNVEHVVVRKGGTVTSHNTGSKVIEFTITRTDVLDEFKRDVKEKVDGIIYRRRYYVDPDWIENTVMLTPYDGYIELTWAEFLTHVGDKTNDDATTLDTHSYLI